jgi:hypothetical protein
VKNSGARSQNPRVGPDISLVLSEHVRKASEGFAFGLNYCILARSSGI